MQLWYMWYVIDKKMLIGKASQVLPKAGIEVDMYMQDIY